MRLRRILFITLFCFLASFAQANAPQDPLAPVAKQLVENGVAKPMVDALFSRPEIRFHASVPRIFFTIRESKLDYDQFTRKTAIAKARRYQKQHGKTLLAATRRYGVDAHVICAILLVETRLGAYTGKRPAAASLASIAALSFPDTRDMIWESVSENTRYDRTRFDERAQKKARWAFSELKALLTYCSKNNIAPHQIVGSYAGAVGIPQFMPSSILHYGADGNKDGKIDLSHHEDAIFSVARYLSANGWRPGISAKKREKVVLTYNKSRPYARTVLAIAEKLSVKGAAGSVS